MPYILYKTDGTKLTTVDDANLDTTTDLSFVGRNYSGYGQVVNENFLKLLENFSGSFPPSKPVRGQLWFDKGNGRLNLSYDGKSFKGIASIFVQSNTPANSSLVRGDLWWDSDAFQLKAFDGVNFQIVGPFSPAAGRATWIPGEEEKLDEAKTVPISKAFINEQVIAIVSKDTFTATNSNISENFPVIKRGITLYGADEIGSTTASGTILWGTAAHALNAVSATISTTAIALRDGGTDLLKSSSSTGVTSYYSSATTSTQAWTLVQRDSNANIHGNLLVGVATSARYADLAERYHADSVYDQGTVVVIGGINEITITDQQADTRIIGVISTNPAVMMNAEAGNNDSHPFVALKGRVPCKVFGEIKKGDLLVSSNKPGYAQKWKFGDSHAAILGKALADNTEGFNLIEVLII